MVIDILNPNGTIRCSKCRLNVARYASPDNIAIGATCTSESRAAFDDDDDPLEEGEPWGILTVNPQEKLPEGMICVKDYSEGRGNLHTLAKAGLVELPPVREISSGFVKLPVVRLTEAGLALVKEQLESAEERRKTA